MPFNGFSRVLPDPYNPITTAGQQSGSQGGPGFASVSMGLVSPGEPSRTNSGKVISREFGGNYLTAKITYNKLTRDSWDPVSAFLLSRNCKVVPFYVELPQYSSPRDAAFKSFCTSNIVTAEATNAGKPYIIVTSAQTIVGLPKPNSLINISDPQNTNHTKAYMITRVETATDYEIGLGSPGSNKPRLHLHAPVSKSISNGANVIFLRPKLKCLLKSSWEVELDNDALFDFGLQIEEAEY